MLDFKLTPSSGFVDSYLDVKFKVSFPGSGKSQIQLFNENTGKPIEILSVSDGRIVSETTIVTKARSVEGYINLFNRDKMNTSLEGHYKVDIRCEVDVGGRTESSTTSFYNQSQSIDSNIIPFDLSVINPQVDLKNNTPLQIYLVCDREKRYELCIMNKNRKRRCTFEITTRIGGLTVALPSEVLWFDLGLKDTKFPKHFDVYWVKFEGVAHHKFMNRKYIPIDNTKISFNDTAMMPLPTARLDPTGQKLSNDFVLSHRYYVHTLKPWSEFGKAGEFGSNRLSKLTMFWHESQYMDRFKTSIFDEEKESKQTESSRAMFQQEQSNALVRSSLSPHKKVVFDTFSDIYTKKTAVMSSFADPKSKSIIQAPKKSGGCGCSRKK